MTSEYEKYLARAEKIQKHCLAHGGICSGPEVLAIIATQIQQAVDDGFRKDFRDFMELNRLLVESERMARRMAFEEATKIVRLKLTRFRPEEPGAGVIIEIENEICARAKEFKP